MLKIGDIVLIIGQPDMYEGMYIGKVGEVSEIRTRLGVYETIGVRLYFSYKKQTTPISLFFSENQVMRIG